MEALFMILLLLFIIEYVYRPRIETTKENDILMFYGKKTRNWIFLWKNN